MNKKLSTLLLIVTMAYSCLGVAENIENTCDNLEWKQVTQSAAFSPRDSATSLKVKETIYLFGGWSNSPVQIFQDSFYSTNGSNWFLLNQDTKIRSLDFSSTVYKDDNIYIIGGGQHRHGIKKSIFKSKNARDFVEVVNQDLPPRMGMQSILFNNNIYVLGGVDAAGEYHNDVYLLSGDGNSELLVQNAKWSPRAYHGVLVFRNKLWLVGGGQYHSKNPKPNDVNGLNDIWISENGVDWKKVGDAPWEGRIWFGLIEYKDYLFVLGGRRSSETDSYKNLNDVWVSKNGEAWHQLNFKKVFDERHAFNVEIINNELFVFAGNGSSLKNDVWKISIPKYCLDELTLGQE